MAKLIDINGIEEKHAQVLQEAGITTSDKLLEKGADVKGRKAIASMLELEAKDITRWFNQADLYRIKGVGKKYADLLERAGVDTVPELAVRKAENLYAKLKSVAEAEDLVTNLPTPENVEDWVAQAKELPRALHY